MALAYWWCPAAAKYGCILFSICSCSSHCPVRSTLRCTLRRWITSKYWSQSRDVLWDWSSFFQAVNLDWSSVRVGEDLKSSHLRIPSVILLKSCWTSLKTSSLDITPGMVIDELSISDKSESEVPHDAIAFVTSKLVGTSELLANTSRDRLMYSVKLSWSESSSDDETGDGLGFNSSTSSLASSKSSSLFSRILIPFLRRVKNHFQNDTI